MMQKHFNHQNGVSGRSSLSARLVAPGRSFLDYQAEAGRYVTTGEKDSQQKNEECIITSTNNFVSNITYDNSNVINNSDTSVNKN